MKRPLIIAGFAGIGKTYLANKYKNVVDLESSKFFYDYSNIDPKDYEKLKGTKNRPLNKNFPKNYIDAIEQCKKEYDVLLIWLKLEMLPLYEENSIDYQICLPSDEAFKTYRQRYEQRGNNQGWIDHVMLAYTKYVNALKDNKHEKIILDVGETLESYLLKNGVKLEAKDD